MDGMVGREIFALEALKELRANYVPPIWKGAERASTLWTKTGWKWLRAQREYAAGLAGLDAAFKQAQHEITGSQISMATMTELEKAKQLHSEAQTLADQPANMVD